MDISSIFLQEKRSFVLESSPPPRTAQWAALRRPPDHSDSGLTRLGGGVSYGFGWLSYDFTFLSYVFRVLSYGLRFLTYERTFLPALTKRKGHSIGKQSAAGGLPSGRRFGRRPIHSDSGLTRLGGGVSDGFGRLSYDLAFLSYGF